jgi:hypothetical protein
MCNCIQETKEKVVEHMKTRLPDGVIDGTFEASIAGQVFRFDGSNNTIPAMTINAEFRQTKVNGEPMKSAKKISMPVFGTHCPFCGEAHKKPE